MKRKKINIIPIVTTIALLLFVNSNEDVKQTIKRVINQESYNSYSIDNIPEYNKEPYVVLNNNEPEFDDKYKIEDSFEIYSSLDKLDRAGVAFANVSLDTMPDTKRGSIGNIKPSGWHTIKYNIVDGKYLYNRCHLIGYQLTGENDNPKNLITCTRYMNTKGMLEFENKVTKYVKETKNHVLYRATPIYVDDNLLAHGVQLEAYSIEDNGDGIKFNVFVYNVQDGIDIDYKTGNSKLKG